MVGETPRPENNEEGTEPVEGFLRAFGISPERAAGMEEIPEEPQQPTEEEPAAAELPQQNGEGKDNG